jgi:tight adherence protein B
VNGRLPMRRGLLVAAAVCALVLPASAAAKVRVKAIDATAFPTIGLTVVTSSTANAMPTLTENGEAVRGYSAQKLKAKSVVLAIDTSESMTGRPFTRAIAAARAFVAAKPRDDRIALVSFASTALELTSFSTATIDADSGLRALSVSRTQGTALYDAVVLGANALTQEHSRAKVLILLTDGRDVSSTASLRDALTAARRAHVLVYSIALRGRQFTPAPLRELATATGGGFYAAASPARFKAAYDRIAAELRHTWLLEYSTAARPGDHLRYRITAPGSGTVTTEFLVPGAAKRPPPHESRFSSWRNAAILGGVVGLILLVLLRAWFGAARRSSLRGRLEPFVGSPTESQPMLAEPRQRFALLAPLFRVTERALAEFHAWRRIERQLVRANIPLRTVEFFYVMIGAGALLALVAAVAGIAPIVVLFLFVLGALAPYLFVGVKARRRLHAFEAQLPAALNTLAASLKAGHSFTQAIQGLVESGGPPLDGEFKRVLNESRLGQPLDAALEKMGHRIGSSQLDFVLRSVIMQRQVGGSLANLFELVAETVTRRQQFRQKIRGLTAMGRMSASILAVLPFITVGLLTAANSEYMRPLYHTNAGHIILIVSVTMVLFGTVVLRRVATFKG